MSIKKYNKLTNQEKLALVRFYPEEAKKDEHWRIRLEAYRALGYTEKALNDKDYDVRLRAYRTLGFTEQALKDENADIRQEAKIYLDFIKLNN